MYDYDDYCNENYYEPTIADELLIEFQQKMKDALLDSVKSNIENTKNENIRLKEENNKLKNEQYQVKQKERELLEKEKTLEKDFFKKKFSEMIKPFEEKYEGYFAESKDYLIRKCKQCDENRQITFSAPNGKIIKQNCDCRKYYEKYVPKHTVIVALNLSKSKNYYDKCFTISPEYEDKDDDYRWCKLKFTQIIETFDESMASDLKDRDTLFKSKEECQKYCNWLNKNKDNDEEEEENE